MPRGSSLVLSDLGTCPKGRLVEEADGDLN